MKQTKTVFLHGNKCNCKFTIKKPSPSDINYPIFSPEKKSIYCVKRLSLSASATLTGSMTVEAAVVLPVFLFFILNLLFYIEIFSLHSVFTMTLRETGNEMAVYGHIYDRVCSPDESNMTQLLENVGFTYLYVKEDMIRQLGKEYLEKSPVLNGAGGLNFLQSQIMNKDDRLDIVLTYKVTPLIDIAGFPSFYMINRYYAKAYTGYEIAESKAEEYVYLAENGKVYHTGLNCTHLKLSIRQAAAGEVPLLRNRQGEKYTACPMCSRKTSDAVLYITEQGNRYHGSIECSGLKRTVTAVPAAQAKTFPMCTRCQDKE